jgi:hypothetical protein
VELIGLYLVAAGLLCVAGAAKAARPDDTARALGALLPGAPPLATTRRLVRGGAAAEAVLGAGALLFPRPLTAALVALSYVGFSVAVAVARRRGGPLATCGCFGRPDTPATALHLIIDLVLAGAAATVTFAAPAQGTLAALLAHEPWAGVPLLLVSAAGLWLTTLALSTLAALTAVRRRARSQAVASS